MSCGWMPSITNDSTPDLRAAVPMMRSPGTSASRAVRVFEQVVLVRGDRGEVEAAQEVDRRAEADDAGDVRRARLELVRHRRPGASSRTMTVAIMSPPPWYGGISSSQRALAVERAGAGRAVHLVRREREEVAADRLHVDRQVRRRLGAVDEHRHAARRAPARRSRAPAGWCRARSRRAMIDTIFVRSVEEPLELLEAQLAALVDRHDVQLGAGHLRDQLPRHDVRVVLEPGDEDLVARLEARPREALRHQVQAVGAALGEDDLAGLARVDEARDLGARAFVGRPSRAPTAGAWRDGCWRSACR